MSDFIDACPIARPPLDHQLETWRRCRDKKAWGHLWEQGTGKSTEILMQCAWLFSRGEINGLIIWAPNGVELNWITDELPVNWPAELGEPNAVWFRSDKIETKWHQEELERCVTGPGFSVLAMSWDSLLQADRKPKPGTRPKPVTGGRSWAKRFLTEREVMAVGDESSRIKTPSAKRTMTALKAARHAKYVRILNGTPVPNGAFDIYSQIKFLDPAFWSMKGISTFQGFKTQFGEWGRGYCFRPDKRTGEMKRQEFPELKRYKNLDMLNKWLSEISDRVTKDEVLDLPPKVYRTLTFHLTPAQRKVYNQLREDCFALLESGDMVSTPLVLTKLLRLQQVTCGYVPVDALDEDGNPNPIVMIGDENPRLNLLMELVQDLSHSAIIWSRFRKDVDLIMESMQKHNLTAVRYDGAVDAEGRAEAKAAFTKGDAQFFVGNPAAGSTGLTLLGDQSSENRACRSMFYYSNGLNLQDRLQSEDRAHRIGQEGSLLITDFAAADTVDQWIVQNLKDKLDVASQVTGDKFRDWIR